ncbi:hypothetical protein ST47_g750 [Ascochyta rabiei]|uniref:Uncharacterized protein n=1 Tax=Didymella rabiei TaxID=5454 RepID=A0A163LTN2_DIDRA|nr:hypothetical protein ST47_g750 [Ascochyta rabiei]
MSGLEIAGVPLGAFPLTPCYQLEHWRDVAKVGEFWWRVRKEYSICHRELQFQGALYKQNLKELLLSIVSDASEVASLMSDLDGKEWSSKALREQLYMGISGELNEAAEELRNELSYGKTTIQSKLEPTKLSLAKSKLDYEAFRLKFSSDEPVKKEIFRRLKDCNERLEKLLSTSDTLSALGGVDNTSRLSPWSLLSRKCGGGQITFSGLSRKHSSALASSVCLLPSSSSIVGTRRFASGSFSLWTNGRLFFIAKAYAALVSARSSFDAYPIVSISISISNLKEGCLLVTCPACTNTGYDFTN